MVNAKGNNSMSQEYHIYQSDASFLYVCTLTFQLAIMDTEVSRNYFGRQVHSFEADINIKDSTVKETIHKDTYPGIFIRAPAIVNTLSDSVRVLATIQDQKSDTEVIVGVQQGNIISTAFHPELTQDCSWHVYFLKKILDKKS